ncbi:MULTISPECIES: DinB family protein [unclassified Dysgonomonas]|uniref:DinB family protein n=1 Tax=unclassified Dysgonomonas TaxID=2630389 RepID=UPI0025C4AFE1|nr:MULTISPECIES: DinB family protein [unclassified Dysgonomonas]HMM02523.1 DinB family protein [Dysgonomonas sp.]
MEISPNADFSIVIDGIGQVIRMWENKLLNLPVETISEKRNTQNRTIKQLIGHLIDSASNNQQRMVRLQYSTNLVFPDYTQDNDLWIAIQNYQESDWISLVGLWKYYNLHIIQVIKNVDISKLGNIWTDFEGNVVTLEDMINGYLGHLHLHMGEIKELADWK